MRTDEEIKKEMWAKPSWLDEKPRSDPERVLDNQNLLLKVLLDIRRLLTEAKK